MILKFKMITNEQFNVRSTKDNRKKVNRISVAYYLPDMHEIRKGFEHSTETSYNRMVELIPMVIDTDNTKYTSIINQI